MALAAALAFAALAQPPPASAPRGPTSFQPGIKINWAEREVQVDSRVVLRSGALEFFACWPGKEHESIVRCDAAAAHVYQALGLLGLLPGHPPVWDAQSETYGEPAGDLVDITVQWREDGRFRTADAHAWLLELEYTRPPLSRPWVFAGSRRLGDGSLASDSSGVGVALVDFPDSLICLSRRFSSASAELWAAANTVAIPPVGTPVCMLLRPARVRPHRVDVDFRGDAWLDERWCAPADLADVIRLSCQLDPDYVQDIHVHSALRSDVERLRTTLRAAGVPAAALRFELPSRDRQGAIRGP